MAISFVRVLATGGNEVASTTIVLTLANTVPVGDTIVVTVAADNHTAGGFSSIGTTTDSKGNTWSNRDSAGRNPGGVVDDGVGGAIFSSKLTTQMVSGDTITHTFQGGLSPTAKAMQATHFSGVGAFISRTSLTANGGSGTYSSSAMSAVSANSLLIGFACVEGGSGDTFTEDADTQDGSWSSITRASSGNTTTSSVTSNAAYKIVDSTPSGTQTYNPTGTSRDWGSTIIEFAPAEKAVLTEGSSTTDLSSYATASITPTANRLVLLAVASGVTTGAVTTPTATGNGLTWNLVATQQATNTRTTVFAATGASPSAGAITIDFGGVTQHNCCWSVSEFTGMTTVVQSNTGTATSTSPSVTLASAVTGGNATYAALSQNVTTQSGGTFYEPIGTQRSQTSPSNRQSVEWDVSGANPQKFTTGSVEWAMVALEMGPNLQASAAVVGAGAYSATGLQTHLPSAGYAGAGTYSATGVRTVLPTAGFAGAGSYSATGLTIIPASAGYAGAGAYSGTAAQYDPHVVPSAKVYIETTAGVWVDVTADFQKGSVKRGKNAELDKYSTGTASLQFVDSTRKYDPVYTAGPLYGYLDLRHRMKITAFHAGFTYPIFLGYIDSISENRVLADNAVITTIKLSDYFKVLNKYTINGTSFISQLPGARINAVLDIIDATSSRNIDTGVTTLQLGTYSSTLLSHAQNVEITEFGDFFIQSDGKIRFKGRDAALSAVMNGTYGDGIGEHHYKALTPQFDDSYIRNPVTVTRNGGTAQTASDAALYAAPPTGYGRNQFDLSGTYHNSDANALSAAQYILARFKLPKRRVVGIELGPVPYAEGPLTYPEILSRELTDRILIRERPMGLGTLIEQSSIIEGIEHTFSPSTWSTKFNVAPSFGDGGYWTLGVSQLGSDTTLYF